MSQYQNFAEIVSNSDLLEQVAATLEQRILNNPHDEETLGKLGEIYRKQGDLTRAANVYRQLYQLSPNDERARYCSAVLSGEVPPNWSDPDGLQPAPFLLIRDYLSEDLHQRLLSYVLEKKTDFEPTTVDDWVYAPDYNNSLGLLHETGIQQSFREHVAATLPSILPRLLLSPFRIERIMVQIKAYTDGHFFRIHHDGEPFEDEHDRSRRLRFHVNFGYLFHRQPRRYQGGDLLLFDTDFRRNTYDPTRFVRIVPEDNCIVFYPSLCFHEVTPIHCPSKDFDDSRFAIVGAFWIQA